MRRNASFLLQTVTASKAANVEVLGLGSFERHSVELEDFDLGLESAGDQGDDSFGELQGIWGFSDKWGVQREIHPCNSIDQPNGARFEFL